MWYNVLMNTILLIAKQYAPTVLRYSMAAVMLWFSIQQFIDVQTWTAYIPDAIVKLTGISAVTLVYFNATFELVFGLLLTFGIYTRIAAFLLAFHLFDIMLVVGYGEIGVRDFGLAFATLVVFMNGPDSLCLQQSALSQNNTESHSII